MYLNVSYNCKQLLFSDEFDAYQNLNLDPFESLSKSQNFESGQPEISTPNMGPNSKEPIFENF